MTPELKELIRRATVRSPRRGRAFRILAETDGSTDALVAEMQVTPRMARRYKMQWNKFLEELTAQPRVHQTPFTATFLKNGWRLIHDAERFEEAFNYARYLDSIITQDPCPWPDPERVTRHYLHAAEIKID